MKKKLNQDIQCFFQNFQEIAVTKYIIRRVSIFKSHRLLTVAVIVNINGCEMFMNKSGNNISITHACLDSKKDH